MKNVITILISLGAVLCYQPAFSQAAGQTQAQAKAEAEQAAEVKDQIAEAMYSRKHAGNHVIGRSKNDPGNISLNGKRYKLNQQTIAPHYKIEKGKKIYCGSGAICNTYVNGKDTIQAMVYYPPVGEGYQRDALPNRLKPEPDSQMTTRAKYAEGNRFIRANTSEDGKSFFVEKHARDPETGTRYEVRVKRNTSHPQSRRDIQGGTFQSVNHSDLRKTFGPSLRSNYNYFGSEATYK